MADELFAGFNASTPPAPPKTPENEAPVVPASDASSLLNFSNPSPAPVAPVVPVPDALLTMIAEAEAHTSVETTPVAIIPEVSPVVTPAPVVPSIISSEENAQAPVVTEKVTPEPSLPQTPTVSLPAQPVPPADPRLEGFIKDDPIYQEMLRTMDLQRIRLSLALRYALLMFGIFLVFAWIVNNRIIMFGFSEFVWLSRIRDALFGLMAGLFSSTIWYGSPVWFHSTTLIFILR
jgi:hypothetical protein